ncbi:hypothetical protein JCM16496A_25700 [Bacteroides rodentium JCM 16496]|jgi:hypothetical protein
MGYTLLYITNDSHKKKRTNYIINNYFFTIMNMEKEMKYEAPLVETMDVEVEVGFAGSELGSEDKGDF